MVSMTMESSESNGSQSSSAFRSSARMRRMAGTGLVVVEGPNDVLRLSTLNQTAIGLMSNTVTGTQAGRIAALARQHAGGRSIAFFEAR
jgi:hypothetical protein